MISNTLVLGEGGSSQYGSVSSSSLPDDSISKTSSCKRNNIERKSIVASLRGLNVI